MPECTKCGESKPVSDFPKYKGKTGNTLYRKKCRACYNKDHLKYI